MKKLLLTIISLLLFTITSLSQSYIGVTEKYIINDQKQFKNEIIDIKKGEKQSDKTHSFTIYYVDNHYVIYFINEYDYCNMILYVSNNTSSFGDMLDYVNNIKYLKRDGSFYRWTEPKDGFFVIWKLKLLSDKYLLIIIPESIEKEIDELLKNV